MSSVSAFALSYLEMNNVHIDCFVDNRFALENKGITIQYTMVHERLISLGTDHKKT